MATDPISQWLNECGATYCERTAIRDALVAALALAHDLGSDYAHSDFTGEYVCAEIRRVIAYELGVET